LPHYGQQAGPLPTLCSPRRRRGRNRDEPFVPPLSGPSPRAAAVKGRAKRGLLALDCHKQGGMSASPAAVRLDLAAA
jgi:hypothetical protein